MIKNLTNDDLRRRLDAIKRMITTLADAWRAPKLNASLRLYIKWIDGDYFKRYDLPKIIVDTATEDTLREFIHNFCTALCAQKLEIETELLLRDQINS